MRSGFTLIETIVALVLLQFGLLAIAAVSAVAARDIAATQKSASALALARNRVELLRASACPTPTTGQASLPGRVAEFWVIEARGAMRLISDSVTFALPRGRPGSMVARASAICAP
ncbi:MAG: type II secretion system protein [Gemmatimonadaceae bacterium]